MIEEFNITDEMLSEAKATNEKFQKKYGNIGTHRTNKTKQRMTGYLAEVAIKYLCGIDYSEDDSVDFNYKEITLDSKAQGCNSAPKDYYVATLYEEQKNRDVDYYVFSRVKNDWSRVWICGFISKNMFFDKAELIPAGTKNNNFVYDQSRFEIQYKNLQPIQNIKNLKTNKGA